MFSKDGMSEDGIITGGPKGNPKGKPKVNTDTVKSKKSKDPFIDQIAALVIPKSITGFAARYIVLKLLKRLVEWGFLSANKAAMLKQNQSPTRRTFKADVITAADLSRIADLFFMKDAHPDKKVLDSYINAAEDVGISEQRALSYLRELLDASTLKKLKLAESYEDNDIDVVYVDVLTGNLHAEEGDNRMPVHIDTRGGQPDDLFGSIEPDLRERILLAAAGGTEPKSGLYPRGITEKGKEIWDRVMKDYGDTFNERYASNKWEHPKNEVLWAYAILTYQNVANKQGVTPFTGGTQPDTRPPDEVAPAPPPAPAPPAPAAPAPAPLPTPEPVPEPAPVPLPVVEEEEIDLDEVDARLAKQVSTTQTMLNRIAELNANVPVKGMLFDFMELGGNRGDTEERRISQIAIALKDIAKNMNIPVLALSQLNRSVESRANKMPSLSDLRYSGQIEQVSDVVVMLTRPEYYIERGENVTCDTVDMAGVALVNIAKNRNGPAGIVRMAFDKSRIQFADMEVKRTELNA